MSNKAINWALKIEATPTQKHLLLVMANFANDEGFAWPSIELLVRATGLSARTVIRARQALIEEKFMSKSNDFYKGAYKLHFDCAINKSDTVSCKNDIVSKKTCDIVSNESDIDDNKSDTLSSPYIYNHNITLNNPEIPPITPKQKPAPTKTKKTTTPKPKTIIPDWVPLDAWNGWLEMRKRKKIPPTARAIELTLRKLSVFREQGHDVGEILDTSTERGWTGIFEPKNSKNVVQFPARERSKAGFSEFADNHLNAPFYQLSDEERTILRNGGVL